MDKIKLQNIPAGKDGDGYITMNGTVLAAFKLAKVSAQLEVTKESKRFLNERMTQNAVRGMAGKGNLTYYHITSALIGAMKDYQNGGEYPNISLHYWSGNTERGRCEVVMRGVIIDNISFGALDESNDNGQQFDSPFTFDDFDVVEGFNA